ncbi:calcium-binding protein [Microseira wollei]|uniref:calcium-binding protein n=1 Tax=Microseira wollei TaxID=467598 RepID=UPI0027D94E47|nr:hypothetical protein [Microseira wollei]
MNALGSNSNIDSNFSTIWPELKNISSRMLARMGRISLLNNSTMENNIFNGGAGDDLFKSGASNDTLNGGAGNDILIGGTGNDYIVGGVGNDLLIGINTNSVAVSNTNGFVVAQISTSGNPGQGEIDTLIGGDGADKFILSDSNNVYYNDGNAASSGTQDYALIMDFNLKEDKIHLRGAATNYGLQTSGGDTNIYLDNDAIAGLSANDELIGIVKGVVNLSLSGSYFHYV